MTAYHTIKSLAEDERPREKLLQKGAVALSDTELLAILINSGTRTRSALDLSRDILRMAHNNLKELGRLSVSQLQQTRGIGKARAIAITAALEIGRRRQLAEGLERKVIVSSADAARIVQPLMQDLNHEIFCVLFLNHANHYLRHEVISSGGLTGTVADIRLILKQALLINASQIVLAHNHPSGNLKASTADRQLTQKLKEASDLMDIRLLDHLIISGNGYLSFTDEGLM